MILVDTSAWFALMSRTDQNHESARSTLERHFDDDLLTHNYVIVETLALVRNRLGWQASVDFEDDLLPVAEVEWIDESTHRVAYAAYSAGERRGVSLVDFVSFEVARRWAVEAVFTYDGDFERAGYRIVG